MSAALRFVVPGPIETLTGGFVYDRRIADGLRRRGRQLEILELSGQHRVDREQIESLDAGQTLLVDGLALPGLEPALDPTRHHLIALVHHLEGAEPTCLEPDRIAARDARILGRMHGIISASAHTRDQIKELNLGPKSIRVVRPGSDPAGPRLRATKRDPNQLRLVCIATITQRKGHDLLLDALETADVRFSLELLGAHHFEPEWAAMIESRIRSWVRPDIIMLRGPVDATTRARVLSESDLFVLASRYEGFGMAAVESVRAGVPVLCSRVGGLPEALEGGGASLVAPERHTFARELVRLANPGPRSKLRDEALVAAQSLPSWDDACDAFDSALEELGAWRK